MTKSKKKVLDDLLEKRIRKYESKFGVKVVDVKYIGGSESKRYKFVIEFKDGTERTYKFGSTSRTTFFDLTVKYMMMPSRDPGKAEFKKKMNDKRAAYIARHSKIMLKNGKKAINVVSPSSLSLIILW